jgi:tetratricopeptide (TPR) repeat protein
MEKTRAILKKFRPILISLFLLLCSITLLGISFAQFIEYSIDIFFYLLLVFVVGGFFAYSESRLKIPLFIIALILLVFFICHVLLLFSYFSVYTNPLLTNILIVMSIFCAIISAFFPIAKLSVDTFNRLLSRLRSSWHRIVFQIIAFTLAGSVAIVSVKIAWNWSIKFFNNFIRPERVYTSVEAGKQFFRLGQYDQAIATVNRVIRLEPYAADALVFRGEVYRVKESNDKALADLNRAIDIDRQYARAIIIRGEIYREKKDHEKALDNFNHAIELIESERFFVSYQTRIIYAQAILNRGEIYRERKNYKDALADFNHLIELGRKGKLRLYFRDVKDIYFMAIIDRGETYFDMEQYEQALKDFNRPIFNPDWTYILNKRGELYRLIGRERESENNFNRANSMKKVESVALQGLESFQKGQFDKALERFDAAIKLYPDYIWAIVKRGQIYSLKKNPTKALDDFTLAIEKQEQLQRPYAWAFVWRGEFYRSLYESRLYIDRALAEKATDDFEKAIELEPDLKWVLELIFPVRIF